MANSSGLLEVTPGLSRPAAVNGLLIAILIERTRISFALFSFANYERGRVHKLLFEPYKLLLELLWQNIIKKVSLYLLTRLPH